jgi:hypothetical protein
VSEKINLRELERKAYLSYHQDGILDIVIGFNILLFGIWILADMAFLAGAFAAIFTPIYAQVKKQVTVPRLGYVKFGPSRIAKTKKTTLFLVIAGVVSAMSGAFLFARTEMGVLAPIHFLIEYGMIVIGVAGAVVLSVVAYTSELRRLYAYAALFLILFTGGHFLNFPFPYFLITLGIAILLSGTYLLIGFQRKYPIPTGE